MVISRTPFRISFFGGGTDYPIWYRTHGGSVLAVTIDKYCYLTCRYLPPFFEHRIRIVYSKIEECHSIDEIVHPAVRTVLKTLNITRGVEIHHDGDLPARSGMGSSSSFTVGLLHAMNALQGKMSGKHELAMEGIRIEQEALKETVGSQDQVMAAYGGMNHVKFLPTGEINVSPIILRPERLAELDSHLMLFYTGIKRTAADVADSYVHDMESRRRQLRIMHDLVDEGLSVLTGPRDISVFGDLLHEGWMTKRSYSETVSNSSVDEIYTAARAAGAGGGKLLGAGGGGFILIFARPDRHEAVRESLKGLIHVPFKFESNGTQIIYYDKETDYSQEDDVRKNATRPVFRELTANEKK